MPKVHEFYFRNQPLTLNSILTTTKKDPDLPNFKKSILHVLLRDSGFEYVKNQRGTVATVRVKVSFHILQISAGSFITGFVSGFFNLCENVHGIHYRKS
jgi:hypothetical protein